MWARFLWANFSSHPVQPLWLCSALDRVRISPHELLLTERENHYAQINTVLIYSGAGLWFCKVMNFQRLSSCFPSWVCASSFFLRRINSSSTGCQSLKTICTAQILFQCPTFVFLATSSNCDYIKVLCWPQSLLTSHGWITCAVQNLIISSLIWFWRRFSWSQVKVSWWGFSEAARLGKGQVPAVENLLAHFWKQ